jgi:hypothetical protein
MLPRSTQDWQERLRYYRYYSEGVQDVGVIGIADVYEAGIDTSEANGD